jgi:hypothetical protein
MKGTRPHELVVTESPEHLVPALVRNLADVVGGQAAYGVQSDNGMVTVASWPPGAERDAGVWTDEHGGSCEVRAGGSARRREDAGLRPANAERRRGHVTVPVPDDGVVLVAGARKWGDREHTVLRETAAWLGMAARLTQLRADHERARARADGLRAEVTAARERLAQVRDLERRRLVGAITTTTLRDLAGVRERLRGLGEEPADLAEVRTALDDLLDSFRTVVRGVYPAMLPDRGPRAALEELAATLPRPVRFVGDLGHRVGWQVESGLYHAVAAVLNLLAGKESDPAITVDFDRGDVLRVRITAAGGSPMLRAALDHDAERLSVLGGAMDCAVTDGVAVVDVRVADRIEPVEPAVAVPSPPEHSPLYRQVRDLVRQGQEAAALDRARWDAVAERLAALPRLAVVGGPAPDIPGVTVVTADGPADLALAEEFLADGPRGSIDAVLCRLPPAPAFRAALRWGRQRVEVTESASPEELARRLVEWRPVIAARRALVAVRELVPALPDGHPLRWAVDRAGAEAHEIAELDLLDDLGHGDSRLLRDAAVDAARLLGAHGTDVPARLGLPEDAGDDEIRTAAIEAAGRWRAHAEHPATGGRDRMACEVLVRTAEGLMHQRTLSVH